MAIREEEVAGVRGNEEDGNEEHVDGWEVDVCSKSEIKDKARSGKPEDPGDCFGNGAVPSAPRKELTTSSSAMVSLLVSGRKYSVHSSELHKE